jgi:hypothetical protein
MSLIASMTVGLQRKSAIGYPVKTAKVKWGGLKHSPLPSLRDLWSQHTSQLSQNGTLPTLGFATMSSPRGRLGLRHATHSWYLTPCRLRDMPTLVLAIHALPPPYLAPVTRYRRYLATTRVTSVARTTLSVTLEHKLDNWSYSWVR